MSLSVFILSQFKGLRILRCGPWALLKVNMYKICINAILGYTPHMPPPVLLTKAVYMPCPKQYSNKIISRSMTQFWNWSNLVRDQHIMYNVELQCYHCHYQCQYASLMFFMRKCRDNVTWVCWTLQKHCHWCPCNGLLLKGTMIVFNCEGNHFELNSLELNNTFVM